MAVIDAIYDALVDEAAFDALPAHLASELGGRSCTVQALFPGTEPQIAFTYFTEEMNAYYVVHGMAEHDPWVKTILQARVFGRACPADSLISRKTFENSLFYNEFFRRFGDDTGTCLGALFPMGGGVFTFGIHRPLSDPGFEPDSVARLDMLIPHLRRLGQTRAALAGAQRRAHDAEALLGTAPLGMALAEADGRVVVANAAAEAIMAARDGLMSRNGALAAEYAADAPRLVHAIAAAARRVGSHGGALLIERPSGAPAYRVIVAPLRAPQGHRDCAVVLIDDPLAKDGDLAAKLVQMFGLTPAEAQLATRLLEGQTPEEAAETRGVRIATVRTQIKGLLGKIGARRQSELTAILARIPAAREG